MRCLIRTLVSSGKNANETRDTQYVGSVLSLGRGNDCDILLEGASVSPIHAILAPKGNGGLRVRAEDDALLIVNDAQVRRADLVVGDRLRVGPNLLEVIAPPAGFDVAFQLSLLDVEEDEGGLSFPLGPMSLREAGASRRKWSWLWALAVFALTLGLPLTWVMWPEPEQRPAWLSVSDAVWSSGPLAAAHHMPGVGDDCGACHVEPFEQVTDAACRACHDLPDHVPAVRLDGVMSHPFDQLDCAGCHREHNEPSTLVRRDEGLCVDCHGVLAETWSAQSELRDVAGFASHPTFKVSLLTPAKEAPLGWTVSRHLLAEASGKEQSNLRFPHDLHLDPQGIDGPRGTQVLGCGDCHQPEDDGLGMRPVQMEAHCSGCHQLTFDVIEPERHAPHAAPAAVLRDLEEYYARLYGLQGGPVVSRLDLSRPARRPGQPDKTFYAAMKAWSEERALEVTTDLLENSACITCHQVDVRPDQQGADRWQVMPVRLADRWMPKAQFDHSAHTQMACQDCHQAAGSATATDVLLPDIDNCQSCHGGESSSDKLATTCVACHGYHIGHVFDDPIQAILKMGEATR